MKECSSSAMVVTGHIVKLRAQRVEAERYFKCGRDLLKRARKSEYDELAKHVGRMYVRYIATENAVVDAEYRARKLFAEQKFNSPVVYDTEYEAFYPIGWDPDFLDDIDDSRM